MEYKEIERIKELKKRTMEYTASHSTDQRANIIWLDCCREIANNRLIDIDNYEHRIESLEFGGDDYP